MRLPYRAALSAVVIAVVGLASAEAQVPPPSPEAADIAACLCLRQSIDAFSADMTARRSAADETQSELTRLDQELARERAGMEINNPQSVAHFRQLLEQRDALFRRSTGPLAAELSAAVSHYNSAVNDYNGRCASRPRDPVLLDRVQATLVCPPAR